MVSASCFDHFQNVLAAMNAFRPLSRRRMSVFRPTLNVSPVVPPSNWPLRWTRKGSPRASSPKWTNEAGLPFHDLDRILNNREYLPVVFGVEHGHSLVRDGHHGGRVGTIFRRTSGRAYVEGAPDLLSSGMQDAACPSFASSRARRASTRKADWCPC